MPAEIKEQLDRFLEIPTWFEDGEPADSSVEIRPGTSDSRAQLNVGGGKREVEIPDIRRALGLVEDGMRPGAYAIVEFPIDEALVLLDHIDPNCSGGAQETTILSRAKARLAQAVSIERGASGNAEGQKAA